MGSQSPLPSSQYVFTAFVPRWPVERYFAVLLCVVSIDVVAFVALAGTGNTREEARLFAAAARHALPVRCPYVREPEAKHPAALDGVFARCAADLITHRAPVGLQLDVMTDAHGRACRISSSAYGGATTPARRHDLSECARRKALLLDRLPPLSRYTVDFTVPRDARVRGSAPAANLSR